MLPTAKPYDNFFSSRVCVCVCVLNGGVIKILLMIQINNIHNCQTNYVKVF